ncbi:kinase-like domain-containing protein [Gigaspora rosea]|uniref:Kinase-like domain-containing protein n=1 Tax=Gigaspora rosea TaxID=44941 RepID=A0A397WCF2_9GLOM|nr:kinase-like domain-containing protein [Gigaspora rosea]
MNWKDKLNLLLCIINDLVAIHSQGIIHKDLHSGNILLDNLHSAYIADLGLSIQYLKQDDGKVYGILPFVAPEVLEKKPYTTASDIYSFGIIMWEVLYGESSTCYFEQDQAFLIVCGMRPKVNEADSNCYIELMKKCWHQGTKIRPTAVELCETFKSWRDDEQIISNLHKFKPNIDYKKLDTTLKCYSKPLNLETSISDELREFLSKNTHIPSGLNHFIPHKTEDLSICDPSGLNHFIPHKTEDLSICDPSGLNHFIPHKTEDLIICDNILNSDQTENLVNWMQENNVHKNDKITVDNSSTINTDK